MSTLYPPYVALLFPFLILASLHGLTGAISTDEYAFCAISLVESVMQYKFL